MLMLMCGWLAYRRNYPRADRWPTLREFKIDMWPTIPAFLAPVLLTVGMLIGYFTPTEIASVTVAYTLFISAVFYRKLTMKGLLSADYETIRATSGILIVVSVAALRHLGPIPFAGCPPPADASAMPYVSQQVCWL